MRPSARRKAACPSAHVDFGPCRTLVNPVKSRRSNEKFRNVGNNSRQVATNRRLARPTLRGGALHPCGRALLPYSLSSAPNQRHACRKRRTRAAAIRPERSARRQGNSHSPQPHGKAYAPLAVRRIAGKPLFAMGPPGRVSLWLYCIAPLFALFLRSVCKL